MKKTVEATVAKVIAVSLAIGIVMPSVLLAHEGHSHSSPSPLTVSNASGAGRFQADKPPLSVRAPHRGKVFASQWQSFEVVYLPQETRIYFYDYLDKPLSARGASGAVIMQVVGNPLYYRNALHYVATVPNTSGQDYLAAQVDVSKIRDGDMRVYFDLVELPFAQEKNLRFDQEFALTGIPTVSIVQFTESDRNAVARQGTCPVMQAGFDHGDPIKLQIGDRAIFVCCEDCIETVKKNPELYLEKAISPPAVRFEEPRPASRRGVASKCAKGCCK